MNPGLIEHYVSGRLSGKEAEEFEAYCVANPEFARQVEYEQRLRAGIAEVAKGSTEEFVRSEATSHWKFAAAASVLLALGALAFIATRPSGLGGQVIMAAISGEADLQRPALRLAQVRGAEQVPTFGEGVILVKVVGLFETEARYSVTLDQVAAQGPAESLTTLYGLRPSSPVSLEFMLDSDGLKSGSYVLRVRKQSSDDEPVDFHVIKP